MTTTTNIKGRALSLYLSVVGFPAKMKEISRQVKATRARVENSF